MDASIVSAMAAVLGSLAGGSATVAVAWITQHTRSRGELVRAELRKRESLYGDFIAECSRLLIDSLTHTLEDPSQLMSAYALLNRIRLSASNEVLREAERIPKRVMDQYFGSNIPVAELRDLVRSSQADPLKAFAEACRAELKAVRASV